jgi:hypothetical protein
MADLAPTSTLVVAGSTSEVMHRTAAATIVAGDMVYIEAVSKRANLADTDSAVPEVRTPVGMALNNAAVGQPVAIAKNGQITMNAIFTKGTPYYLSGAPGKICPFADVAAGDFTCIVGIAVSTTVLQLDIQTAGVAV